MASNMREVSSTSDCDPKSEICVTTKDNKLLAIPRGPWMRSKLLKDLWADSDGSDVMDIPLEEIEYETLQSVHEFLDHYTEQDPQELEKPMRPRLKEYLKSDWDKEYLWQKMLKNGDEKQHEALMKTVLAANYLLIDPLRDLCCAMIADMLRGKTPKKILEMFGIEEEFGPEQQREIEDQYPWMKPKEVDEPDKKEDKADAQP